MDTNTSEQYLIKVSGSSHTSAVAGAIAGIVRSHKHAEVQAIGAGAVNQAVKALILAVKYLSEDGIQISFVPAFADVVIEAKVRTPIKFVIEPRSLPNTSIDHLSNSNSEDLLQT